MSVTVYTKPQCVQCTATKTALENLKISYNLIDITEDQVAFNLVKSLGYSQVPVVISETSHWSGYRPDKIRELKT